MADQNAILRALPAPGTWPIGLAELSVAVNGTAAAVGTLARKQIIQRVGALIGRGLAEAVKREACEFQQSRTAGYRQTVVGAAFLAGGKTVTSGPRQAHTGKAKPRVDTLRTRVWKALRIMKKATVFELIEVAGAPGNIRTAATNVHRFLHALQAVKVTAKLTVRAQGNAPTSNGFYRYALVTDLGPLAPVVGKKGVFDPNANAYIAAPQSREVA